MKSKIYNLNFIQFLKVSELLSNINFKNSFDFLLKCEDSPERMQLFIIVLTGGQTLKILCLKELKTHGPIKDI